MQTIKAYRTRDGQIFESKRVAEIHEERTKFVTWYNQDPITIGVCHDENELVTVTEDVMMNWLKRRNATITCTEIKQEKKNGTE